VVETGIPAAVEDMSWSAVSMVKRDRPQLRSKTPNAQRRRGNVEWSVHL